MNVESRALPLPDDGISPGASVLHHTGDGETWVRAPSVRLLVTEIPILYEGYGEGMPNALIWIPWERPRGRWNGLMKENVRERAWLAVGDRERVWEKRGWDWQREVEAVFPPQLCFLTMWPINFNPRMLYVKEFKLFVLWIHTNRQHTQTNCDVCFTLVSVDCYPKVLNVQYYVFQLSSWLAPHYLGCTINTTVLCELQPVMSPRREEKNLFEREDPILVRLSLWAMSRWSDI